MLDLYRMIVPEKGTFPEYETFYTLYSQNIKMNMISFQLFDEAKEKLPNIMLSFSKDVEYKEKEIDSDLLLIGAKREKSQRDEYIKAVESSEYEFVRDNLGGSLSNYIEHQINYQQFTLLFSIFDGTISQYINRLGSSVEYIHPSELLIKLKKKVQDFTQEYNKLTNENLTFKEINILWQYFSTVRNLYDHTGGIINNKFINRINGLKISLEQIEKKIDIVTVNLFKMYEDDVLKIQSLTEGKLFSISEYAIRLFRTFIINIWESIYLLNVTPKQNTSHKHFSVVNNIYEHKMLSNPENIDLRQRYLTPDYQNFYPSSYICPVCGKNEISLYKARFNEVYVGDILNLDAGINYKARNVFVCPFCRSLFFPKYREKLIENTGFNIMHLSDADFNECLKRFNSLAELEY